MTAGERPNLGGLFTGSTPPERTSSVADVLSPRGPTRLRVAAVSADVHELSSAAAPTAGDQRSAAEWIDPVKAVERYFAFLQGLLDLNRNLAVGVVTAVLSVPGRIGFRR